MMKGKINVKKLAISILIPLAVGGLAAFITRDGMKAFPALRQPPLSPPMWLFPVVWTLLYIMMGTAQYLVSSADAGVPGRKPALTAYAVQLALNFLWTIVFFLLGAYTAAFIVIVLLWLTLMLCIILFHSINRTAGLLFVPYVLWVSFAAYLNLGVRLLNG